MSKNNYAMIQEFFSSNFEESSHPLLTESSRRWGKNNLLYGSILSALFLLAAYFSPTELSHFFLTFVFFFAGTPALIKTLQNLKKLNVNIEVLMTLAAFLSVLIGKQLEGGLLLVLFALAESIERSVSFKTNETITKLQNSIPSSVFYLDEEDNLLLKSVKDVKIGDKISIQEGMMVPIDGVIIEGKSFISQVQITGENDLIPVGIGDTITSGSINLDGHLFLSVTTTNSRSTLSNILNLIHEAQERKPKIQKFLDRFGKSYSTTIILLSLIFTFLLPLIFGISYSGHGGSIYRSLAFLIAASPCALFISTPTAYLCAISAAARVGVLLKGGTVFDALNKCTSLALDKTGTLTEGKLTVSKIEFYGTISKEEGLGIAKSLEKVSSHPMAIAIKKHKAPHDKININDITSIPGEGIRGVYQGHSVLCGSLTYIKKHLSDNLNDTFSFILEKEINKKHPISALLYKDNLIIFHFFDQLRPEVNNLMKRLKKNTKLAISILTGDREESAQEIANLLNIDKVYAALTPEKKVEIVSKMSETSNVAMVGDGTNDSAAIKRSTVGIVMGEIGSSISIESADIILLSDKISLLEWLFDKASQTVRIIRQNIIFALSVIFFVSIPSLFGLIPIWLAVTLHEGSTILVGLNSLRLLKNRLNKYGIDMKGQHK